MQRLLTLLLWMLPLWSLPPAISSAIAASAPAPSCFEPIAAQIANLERELARGAVFVSWMRRSSSWSNAGCDIATEHDYLHLLRNLTNVLGPGLINGEHIAIDITGRQQGYARVGYFEAPANCCWDGCGGRDFAAVRYSVNPASVADLGRHVKSTVVPHLRRMAALRSRFYLLTGDVLAPSGTAEDGAVPAIRYSGSGPPSHSTERSTPGSGDMALFGALETTAATLLREAEKLPTTQLAAHRDQRKELRIGARLFDFDERSLKVLQREWSVDTLHGAILELYDLGNVTRY